jgi:hypothetical protein
VFNSSYADTLTTAKSLTNLLQHRHNNSSKVANMLSLNATSQQVDHMPLAAIKIIKDVCVTKSSRCLQDLGRVAHPARQKPQHVHATYYMDSLRVQTHCTTTAQECGMKPLSSRHVRDTTTLVYVSGVTHTVMQQVACLSFFAMDQRHTSTSLQRVIQPQPHVNACTRQTPGWRKAGCHLRLSPQPYG